MDDDNNSQDSLSIDWDTEDELEVQGYGVPPQFGPSFEVGEASSSSCPRLKAINHFVQMGFPKDNVEKAIKENCIDNKEAILDALLTYAVIENLPPEVEIVPENPHASSSSDNFDENYHVEETPDSLEKDNMVGALVEMGYPTEDVLLAIERCGLDCSLADLSDFILAAQMAKEADLIMEFEIREEIPSSSSHINKRQKLIIDKPLKKRANRLDDEDDDSGIYRIPKPMKGFGVPGEDIWVPNRIIPKKAIGPPYFYYENVAFTPKGVWETISRVLYGIVPEFVDSKYFCAAARKRGYVHNLPIQNRFPLLPIPPMTVHEVLPNTRKWWPSWDTRTQLNCILTCVGSAPLTKRIKHRLELSNGEPAENDKKYIIEQCKKWNLVWVGKYKAAPLEPDEIEMLMGFPKDHTRGFTRTERFTGLGNSFQINTVAYHLSVLKAKFPCGINVLSLFSGIGGAEVALHCLGIRMNNVVSVEKSDSCRKILQSWWEQTNQTGNLIHISDVKEVTTNKLEKYFHDFGGFDLVIGGSPCNNLAGGNRSSRDGLQGEHSVLFYDYCHILDHVMSMMKRNR